MHDIDVVREEISTSHQSGSPNSSSSLPGSPTKRDLYDQLFALEKKKCTCHFSSAIDASICALCNGSIDSMDGKIYSKKVYLDKLVLKDGVEVVEKTSYNKLYEKAKNDKSTLHINLFRGCDNLRKADFPMMPSLALDVLHKNYDEPVRDRDKNWKITSQRDVLNLKGREIIFPDFELELGKYKSIDSTSPLFWSVGFQHFIRESRLFRTAKIVSGSLKKT